MKFVFRLTTIMYLSFNPIALSASECANSVEEIRTFSSLEAGRENVTLSMSRDYSLVIISATARAFGATGTGENWRAPTVEITFDGNTCAIDSDFFRDNSNDGQWAHASCTFTRVRTSNRILVKGSALGSAANVRLQVQAVGFFCP